LAFEQAIQPERRDGFGHNTDDHQADALTAGRFCHHFMEASGGLFLTANGRQ
jgi:hypothetical protein